MALYTTRDLHLWSLTEREREKRATPGQPARLESRVLPKLPSNDVVAAPGGVARPSLDAASSLRSSPLTFNVTNYYGGEQAASSCEFHHHPPPLINFPLATSTLSPFFFYLPSVLKLRPLSPSSFYVRIINEAATTPKRNNVALSRDVN